MSRQPSGLGDALGFAHPDDGGAHAWIAQRELQGGRGERDRMPPADRLDPAHLGELRVRRLAIHVARVLVRPLGQNAAAIRRGMYTLKKAEAMPFEEAMAFTESQIALFTLTDDAREGQLAFQEKRKPVWAGK